MFTRLVIFWKERKAEIWCSRQDQDKAREDKYHVHEVCHLLEREKGRDMVFKTRPRQGKRRQDKAREQMTRQHKAR
jgi:hypothetical protein